MSQVPPLPPSPPLPPLPAVGYAGPMLNYALWGDRVLAALIDGVLNMIVMFVMIFGLYLIGFILTLLGSAASGTGDNPNPVGAMLAAGGMALCCIGPIFFIPASLLITGLFNKVYLVRKKGSSIGQGIMKLRIVLPDGETPPTGKLILRLLCQVGFGLIYILLLLDLLWPLWDARRQTLHDKAVNTYVIKKV